MFYNQDENYRHPSQFSDRVQHYLRRASHVTFDELRVLVTLDPPAEDRDRGDHQQGPHPPAHPGPRAPAPVPILLAGSVVHVRGHPGSPPRLFTRGHVPPSDNVLETDNNARV